MTHDDGWRPILPDPGSASDPASFVGRVATTLQAQLMLKAGRNVALTDPRRMGKSYWITYFCATTQDFVPVKIDFEGVTTSDAFLTRTAEALGRHESIPDRAKSLLWAVFDNLEVNAGPIRVKPAARALPPERLFRDMVMAVNEHATGLPILVCMDEVPGALLNITKNGSNGPLAARAVLQTLRDLRLEAPRLRWIVSGSVGFHHVLRHCQATEGDINDLETLPLGPLPDDEADELIRRLLAGIGRTADEAAIAEIIRTTGGIPFLIQHLANQLDNHSPEVIRPQVVLSVFEKFIRNRDESRAATHLVSRVDLYYGTFKEAAFSILDKTAMSRKGMPLSDLEAVAGLARTDLLTVIDWLVDDHYLDETSHGFLWRYDVLREIWTYRRRLRPLT